MKRIFLIGYMGAGKTTMGKELAKVFGLSFYDLDHFIEARYNKTVALLFEQYGECKFREIEKNVLLELGSFEDVIISTGGGTPCFFQNMDFMLQNGIVLYLEASEDTLYKRLRKNRHKRPLIKNKNDDELLQFISENLQKRKQFYDRSTIIYNTDGMFSKNDMIGKLDDVKYQIEKIK